LINKKNKYYKPANSVDGSSGDNRSESPDISDEKATEHDTIETMRIKNKKLQEKLNVQKAKCFILLS
jgi:hypothetical protein